MRFKLTGYGWQRVELERKSGGERMSRNKRVWVGLQRGIILEIAFIVMLAILFVPGFEGHDLSAFYLYPKGVENVWIPWYGYWLLAPLRVFSFPITQALWAAATVLVIGIVSSKVGGDPLVVLLSFPTIWEIWLGQIEAILALGILLVMSKKPMIRGAGILLLLIKPQVGLILVLFVLWKYWREWRIWVLPVCVLIVSLVQWGFWPIQWLNNLSRLPEAVPTGSNVVTMATGAAILLLLRPGVSTLPIVLCIACLIMPDVNTYTVLLPLMFSKRKILVVLSYLPVLLLVVGASRPMAIGCSVLLIPTLVLLELGGPLRFLEKTNSRGSFLIAAWHWRWSITWRWLLWWYAPVGHSFHLVWHPGLQGVLAELRTPLGRFYFQSQPNLRRSL